MHEIIKIVFLPNLWINKTAINARKFSDANQFAGIAGLLPSLVKIVEAKYTKDITPENYWIAGKTKL